MSVNPFANETATDDREETPSIDEMFGNAVDMKLQREITKRNLPPTGIYVTDPPEDPTFLSVFPKNVADKDADGEPIIGKDGKPSVRRMATVSVKGVKKVRNGDDVTTILRFDVSPDPRPKKEYVDGSWTGEFIVGKDDLATKLYSAATQVYFDTRGEEPPSEAAVLEFLGTEVYAMEVSRMGNKLMVMKLQARRRR